MAEKEKKKDKKEKKPKKSLLERFKEMKIPSWKKDEIEDGGNFSAGDLGGYIAKRRKQIDKIK